VLKAGMESKSTGWLAAGNPFCAVLRNKFAKALLNLSIWTSPAVSGLSAITELVLSFFQEVTIIKANDASTRNFVFIIILF
jgi:hypothetical protein